MWFNCTRQSRISPQEMDALDLSTSAKKSVLIVIPARGGSKGIPRKNLRTLGGRPLLSYSVETALSSSYSPVVLVTSDDAEILAIAERLLHPVPVECRTNTAMHGAELVADLDRFIEGCRQPVSRLSHQPAASTLRTIRD